MFPEGPLANDLADRGLFIRRGDPVAWPDETVSAGYEFRHARHHQALCERVPVAMRRRLHTQIGLRREAAFGRRAREIAAALATHFEAANEPPRAALYHRHVGEAALVRGAMSEGVASFRHALKILDQCPDSEERAREELFGAGSARTSPRVR